MNVLFRDNDWYYLSVRWWVGLWTGIILILMVAFDLSALVRYITRFTEESFAALISIIFIKEAVAKLIQVTEDAPLNLNPDVSPFYDCYCTAPVTTTAAPVTLGNVSAGNVSSAVDALSTVGTTVLANMTNVTTALDGTNVTTQLPSTTAEVEWHLVPRSRCTELGGHLAGGGCAHMSDVFLLSGLLFVFTFAIAYGLKMVKTSRLFPTWVSVWNTFL